MVAKIVKGQNFKGAIDYITDIYGKDKQKKGARLIYHSSGIPPNADNRMMAMLMDSYARKEIIILGSQCDTSSCLLADGTVQS